MDRDEALKLKAEIAAALFPPPELPFERVLPQRFRGHGYAMGERAAERLPGAARTLRRAAQGRAVRPSVALGVGASEDGEHRIMALVQALGRTTDAKLATLRDAAGDIEVQQLGRVVKQPGTSEWPRGRSRPLRIGSSISSTEAKDAGTLGCFVRQRDGVLGLLSNNHVLAGENAGQVGDPIIQPGTRDRGATPDDTVASLASFVTLRALEPNRVDCAVATVVDGCDFDPRQLVSGRLEGIAAEEDTVNREVEKLGRTSKATRGTVTLIEVDNVIAAYDLGNIRFDGVMQIEGVRPSPFSKAGDSGSLIYTADTNLAVALLFGGTDGGGVAGVARSFACPISSVLKALDATLVL
jgi:hypothetical protein